MKAIENIKKIFKRKSCNSSDFYDIYAGDVDKYRARYIIMNKLEKTLDGDGIYADSTRFVHLIVSGTDSLMLNIVRQAILLCHFPNFNEKTGDNRTKITILAPQAKSSSDLEDIKKTLSSRSMLGNLLSECVWDMRVINSDYAINSAKQLSFIDIEIEVIGLNGGEVGDYLDQYTPANNELTTVMLHLGDIESESLANLKKSCHQVHIIDVSKADIPLSVDIRMARRANIVYVKGIADRNIYNNDLRDADKYYKNLHQLTKEISIKEETDSWNATTMSEENRISNVCCTDCYPIYLRSAGVKDKKKMPGAIIKNIKTLGRTEHARWNVEKLIMGFRPLAPEERLTYERKSGSEKKIYRNHLKGNYAHIDLCSMERLECIDLDSLKYDSFLVLAIPCILDSLK